MSKLSELSENPDSSSQRDFASENETSSADSGSAVPHSKFKRMLSAVNAFLESLDVESEPEPPPPPEKTLKETIQEFIERCRDREKRIVMLKEFGEWSWTM